ncbi:hypothetical protein ADUPG1_008682, partial [Aduncisulcus paluster]
SAGSASTSVSVDVAQYLHVFPRASGVKERVRVMLNILNRKWEGHIFHEDPSVTQKDEDVAEFYQEAMEKEQEEEKGGEERLEGEKEFLVDRAASVLNPFEADWKGSLSAQQLQIIQKEQFDEEKEKEEQMKKEYLETFSFSPFPCLVFVNTRENCDIVKKEIRRMSDFRCESFHGMKTQTDRERLLRDFRAQRFDILVSTDVLGRGIDISGIGLVFNYDLPQNIETYTHRIGRTGRAGKKGESHTFISMDLKGQSRGKMGKDIVDFSLLRQIVRRVDRGVGYVPVELKKALQKQYIIE